MVKFKRKEVHIMSIDSPQYAGLFFRYIEKTFPDAKPINFNSTEKKLVVCRSDAYIGGFELNGKKIRVQSVNSVSRNDEAKADYYIWISAKREEWTEKIEYYASPCLAKPQEIEEVIKKMFSSGNDSYISHSDKPDSMGQYDDRLCFHSCEEIILKISEVCGLPISPMQGELCELLDSGSAKQIILTGAPGTGKTYTALQVVKGMAYLEYREFSYSHSYEPQHVKDMKDEAFKKFIKFVQFHPSYDYTDFVEGLRPVMINGKNELSFVRLDGIFKAFCRRIVEETDEAKKAKKEKEPIRKYFFIIDEINRADLSEVFGELMYGLEESYRGREHTFHTRLHQLPTYQIGTDGTAKPIEEDEDVFRDGFYIPENLYIIGTMNDIDRSVETFDFALRRRFLWLEARPECEIEPAFKAMLQKLSDTKPEELIKLIKQINEMNRVIREGSGRIRLGNAYQIGHAYFRGYDGTDDSLNNIWTQKIEPLLREYCRGHREEDTEDFIGKCHTALCPSRRPD